MRVVSILLSWAGRPVRGAPRKDRKAMYKKVNPNLDWVAREKETLKFWNDNRIFQKSLEQTKDGKPFNFYDGPPTANGRPHIGHILTRVMKDIIPRYKTMRGYYVRRKAGWDTHGLPVELEVEKALGIDGKQEIEKYGVEEFIAECKKSVWKYKSEWEEMSGRVGFWADMDDPYITYEDDYIESVWWSISELDKKGLLYKGHKIVPYCPRCGTSLSSHEVAQGYKDVTEETIVAAFALTDEADTYFLAWTTTPWTLPSNVALCVNPKYNYATVEHGGKKYILAEDLAGVHFPRLKGEAAEGAEPAKIISVCKGAELERKKYTPLFDFHEADAAYTDNADSHYITCGDFVTLTDGTGIVHIAPAFGEDDAKIGRAYNLPFVQLVDDRGKFVEAAGAYFGLFVKKADKQIIKDLAARGLVLSSKRFTHSYPYCWRCDTPLLYYARSSWFVKTTAIKNRLLKNNDKIGWMPPNIGTGRMGNFLSNVIDWGLSRERYWGTPLPVWACKCGGYKVIGSKAELQELSGHTGDIELHKPFVDKLTFPCGECGGDMVRDPAVIDCWYDSGAMPFAQYHYPFENKDIFEAAYPADFISEAVDQTRGWFYTLLAISTALFGDKPSFKNCIVLGHVGDKNGVKMSKHKGNVVDPYTVLDKQGADAVRWHFYTSSAPWLPSRFYEDAVSEAQRYLGTLWNVYSFYILYAGIDKFDPTKYKLSKCKLSVMDRWILSELNSLTDYCIKGLDKYRIFECAREINGFVDRLSNWYVRRGRERYWGGGMTEDKTAAFMTLYTVLETLARLTAPFIPFMAEAIWSNAVRTVDKSAPISVHLAEYPKVVRKLIDTELETKMKAAYTVAVLGRAARNLANIKNRQPLSRMLIGGADLDEGMIAVIADELNIKVVELAGPADGITDVEVKPQLKALGPKYGKQLGEIRTHLAANGAAAAKAVADGGVYIFKAGGAKVELTFEDLLITQKSRPGYTSASDKGITVALSTELTPALIDEGNVREIISKIQTMRKESGFEVTDRIDAYYKAGKLASVIAAHKEQICAEVLADGLTNGLPQGSTAKEWDINGVKVALCLRKIG